MQAQTIATTAPAIEISTQQEIMVTFAHPPPCSHDGYCLRVDVKPSTLKLWGLSAPSSWGSRSCSSLTPTHQVRFSPLPRTCFAPRLAFARSASFSLCSPSASRCWTLRRSRSELAGLAPLMGKASVSNIMVSSRSRPGLVPVSSSSQKPILSPLCRLWLACACSCLHPPSGSVRLHPTAKFHSLAGTPLLIIGWHPPATRRLARYCSSLLAGIPSARWLRSPIFPLRSSDLSSVTPSRGIALPP